MKPFLALLLCLAILPLGVAGVANKVQPPGHPCKMSKIETAQSCANCDILEPKLKDGVCEACQGKVEVVQVCVVHFLQYSSCEKDLSSGATCCKDAEMVEKQDKVRLLLRCKACGAEGEKAGPPCLTPACQQADQRLAKVCGKSGKWPHGGTPPTADARGNAK